MKQIIVVTGASSGFGALASRALAMAGHTVYAGMRSLADEGGVSVADLNLYAERNSADLRAIELDVQSDASVEAAIAEIIADCGRIDVVVQNAGHMAFGPAEAFTVDQFAQLYDVNVLSTQRMNRAALPHMRKQGKGLVLWVSSSSARGGTPPYLAPYFAAKAAMDSLAVSYAGELARWGIETSIVVPGAFTKGTNHFKNAGAPDDTVRAAEYASGPGADLPDLANKGIVALEPADSDAGLVADAIVAIVDTEYGKRPFRVHVDPSQDGSEIVNAMADRVRAEFLRRIGLEDILKPRVSRSST